jgi:outer membrane autotransporter protein
VDDQTLSGAMLDSTIQAAGVEGTILGSEDNPWGMFVAGTLVLATQDSSSREAGFDLNGADFTAGFDYAFDENTLLGFALSYGMSALDHSNGGSLDTRSVQLALYGATTPVEGLQLDGYAGLALTDYELTRIVSVPGIGTAPAEGDFSGEQFSAALRMKYQHSLEGFDIESYGMLSYLGVWTDAYTETGGLGAALSVDKQFFDTLSGTLGVRISRAFNIESAIITPYIGGSYTRQFDGDSRSVTSTFAAAGLGATPFTVRSDSDGENIGTFDFGFNAINVDQTKTSLGFSGTFSDGGFEGYSVKAGLTIPFNAQKQQAPPPAPVEKRKKKPAPQAPEVAKPEDEVPEPPVGGTGGGGTGGGGGWN